MRIENLLLLFILAKVTSLPIDNGVIGDPEIKCGDISIDINFRTINPFGGHVFAKGRYGEPGCRIDETNQNAVQMRVPFNACGVKRTRSANPRGVFVTVAVIITFHPQFITKIDKAYALQCFYMEAEKIVTTELEVSMLTTSVQTQTVPMPICRYEVLDNGPFGNPIRFAKVGEQVYHKWTCDTETSETFCMTVHSCNVDDGSGNKVVLLNSNGCAQDKYLLGNLEYPTDLMAGRESHVFKYADRPSLFFNCQISIVIKEPGVQCVRPQCPDLGRKKRSDYKNVNSKVNYSNYSTVNHSKDSTVHYSNYNNASSSNYSDTIDVNSESLTIVDIDPTSNQDINFETFLDKQISMTDEDICMSVVGLSGYTAVNVILIVSSTFLLLAAYRKQIAPTKSST